ncbi:putative phospholipid-transporting ATPase IF [Armadillidium nasatum]|uniref:Putative phospholipid-transporting ATPase IF n=1 Tax=Armadillidium nasatum TaxID=96803 RepID=A0A5N5SKQ9_9CRUS|nr:putative phospholipid-transporting ATPase IF [Armadillidium nasatum]
MWYLGPTNSSTSAKSVFEDGFSFFILFSYIIPISLYVTLEMQKFLGTFFFQWDKEMKYKETGEYAICNTSDLNEELGQIQYLFTDKTGTLTENTMCFQQCSIAGVKFFDRNGLLKSNDNESIEPIPINIEEVLSFQQHIDTCLLVLALCHTVQTRKVFSSDEDSSSSEGDNANQAFSLVDIQYEYHASSPDEKALVEACARYGIVLEGEIEGKMFLSVQGEKRTFERLETLEFDSGLRTLAVARKKISDEEFKSISKKFAAAKQEIRNREKALQSVMEEVESNLTLLGATAVEDLLQDGVQETLESLSLAGIKVWVLTGDKVETAVNIAYLCGLFKRFMTLIYLVHFDGVEGAKMKLEESEKELEKGDTHFGLVVDGASLMILMENFKKEFYRLCKKCSAVVCCRMSPRQKAEIVQLVKSCSKKRTVCAAVGDGANDVSMIQEAHIGLGIMGKEGRQAVRCSDFAFGRFRFLQRAILVHGHWYYTRISTLIHYCFYKNVAFNTPQVFFAFQSAYSTQQVYSDKELLSKPYLYREIRNNRSMSWAPFIVWGLLGFWHSAVLYYGLFATTFETPFINDGKSQDIYLFGVMLTTNVIFVCNLKLVVEAKYQTWIFIGSILLTMFGFYLVYFIYCIFPKAGVYFTFYVFHGTAVFYFSLIILVVVALLPDVLIKIFMNTKKFSLRDELRKYKQNIKMFNTNSIKNK